MNQDNETFYDEQIAPELARLAQLCAENNMSLLAAVEYAPGSIAETRLFSQAPSWAMEMLYLALLAMGNLDRLVINVAQLANARDDLDETSSLVLQVLRHHEAYLACAVAGRSTAATVTAGRQRKEYHERNR